MAAAVRVVVLVLAVALGLSMAVCVGDGPFSEGLFLHPPATSISTGLPETMPADFGFVFKYGTGFRFGQGMGGRKNVLDTFAGTFTKDMVSGPSVTTQLRLSESELRGIYAKMVAIGLGAYPPTFQPHSTGTLELFSTYQLDVRSAGREFTIEWDDRDVSPPDAATSALRELLQHIQRVIESHPEYRQLPPAQGAYASREWFALGVRARS